jgi:hypothetical protein
MEEMTEFIPSCALAITAYWHKKGPKQISMPLTAGPPPHRASTKVGRNDPCPCSSKNSKMLRQKPANQAIAAPPVLKGPLPWSTKCYMNMRSLMRSSSPKPELSPDQCAKDSGHHQIIFSLGAAAAKATQFCSRISIPSGGPIETRRYDQAGDPSDSVHTSRYTPPQCVS